MIKGALDEFSIRRCTCDECTQSDTSRVHHTHEKLEYCHHRDFTDDDGYIWARLVKVPSLFSWESDELTQPGFLFATQSDLTFVSLEKDADISSFTIPFDEIYLIRTGTPKRSFMATLRGVALGVASGPGAPILIPAYFLVRKYFSQSAEVVLTSGKAYYFRSMSAWKTGVSNEDLVRELQHLKKNSTSRI
jgi:hypothetical protein